MNCNWLCCQFFFMLCSWMPGFSQDPHPSFRQYTVEDGLPSSEVYQVKQDSKGHIWFATGNGVSCFNGYEFENFSITSGLPDNTVFEIYEDTFDRIWFVPLSCKLSYYYKGKIYPYPYNDQFIKMLINPVKTSFCVDTNGTVFLGVTEQGIIEISKKGKIIRHFFPYNNEELSVIQPTPATYVFSSHLSGFLKSIQFQTKQHQDKIAFSKDKGTVNMIGSTRIIDSRRDNLFVSIGTELLIMNHKHLQDYTVQHFPTRVIWIYEDADNDIWIGTLLGGVYYIHKGDFEHKKCFLKGLSVNGILQDKEGGFWFATEGSGVFYNPSKKVLTYDETNGLADNRVTCFATDNKKIYAGSQNGFIGEIEANKPIKNYNINFNSQHANGITALFYDSIRKQIWVAGKTGATWLKDGKMIKDPLNFSFNAMLVDAAKTTWIVSTGEVTKIVKNHKMSLTTGNNHKIFKRANGITAGKNGMLMIGAINGLWTLNTKENNYYYLGYKNKLLQNRILDLAYCKDSFLVMGTKGAGVLFYDNKNVVQINTSKGLCGDNVYAICIDSSIIWAATNKGLNKISIIQINPLKFKITSYTTVNGLAFNEINDVVKVDQKIWVASNKGVSFFYPDSIDEPAIQLPLYLKEILINDKDTAVLKDYQLAYDQNNIKINFTGLSYKNTGKLKYRYKMIGLDSNWIYTSTREVQFTTLPANTYTFVLNVMNMDETWSSNVVIVHFIIAAPFWKKWWFILGVVLLSAYSMFYLIRYRLRKVQLREEKISDLNKTLVSLKLKALRAQMNPHFTFNVMNSIQHFIATRDGEAANRYLSRFSKLIRLILNNSEKSMVPIADEIKALELYLELEAMRFEERFNYSINVDKSINVLEVEIPSMLIQPYVENSIKHGILTADRPGIIKIEILKQDTFLKCIIEDNGVGRSQSYFNNRHNTHKSFGTIITQERLAAINTLNNVSLSQNVIDLEDENGNALGTRVEIYIPFT
jgi:sensor histidine kinase YesM/ligand-binding sensor domain-containing protein